MRVSYNVEEYINYVSTIESEVESEMEYVLRIGKKLKGVRVKMYNVIKKPGIFRRAMIKFDEFNEAERANAMKIVKQNLTDIKAILKDCFENRQKIQSLRQKIRDSMALLVKLERGAFSDYVFTKGLDNTERDLMDKVHMLDTDIDVLFEDIERAITTIDHLSIDFQTFLENSIIQMRNAFAPNDRAENDFERADRCVKIVQDEIDNISRVATAIIVKLKEVSKAVSKHRIAA